MRNCVIGVIGIVVQKALTGEDLTSEQREKRDECLDNLEEHILDCNAYVRSKVLQTWQRLCCEGAVPIARREAFGRHCAAFGRQERDSAKASSLFAAHSVAEQSFHWQSMRKVLSTKLFSTVGN